MDIELLTIKTLNTLHTLHIVDSSGMLTRSALVVFSVLAIVGGIVLIVDGVKHIRKGE